MYHKVQSNSMPSPTATKIVVLVTFKNNKQKWSQKFFFLFDQLSWLMNEQRCFLCVPVLWLISYEHEWLFGIVCSSFMKRWWGHRLNFILGKAIKVPNKRGCEMAQQIASLELVSEAANFHSKTSLIPARIFGFFLQIILHLSHALDLS